MWAVATKYAQTRMADRDMPCAQCTCPKCRYNTTSSCNTTYQNFVVPVAIQSPSDKLDNTIEPHREVGGGGILDWDVHDQDSSVERPAHVFFHRRYDVRDTEAVEISGYASSKDI